MNKLLFALLLIFGALSAPAQQLKFWKEIKAFKTTDSIQSPPEKAIVFVGSSSFRFWHNLQESFPHHTVINRGFGGSSLPHAIEYVDEIVIPYKPRQVVIYCGENDFMVSSVTPEIVAGRFEKFFHMIRTAMPKVNIVYVSIKPSIRRQHLMPEMAKANALIKDFLHQQSRATFVNIWDSMLDENGVPRKELFISDMLHMNEKGYAIWQKLLTPHLIKTKPKS